MDEQVLIDALKQMGIEPQIHEQAKPLEGYQGDARKQKAHIIIPRRQVGSSSNDVGFERMSNGGFKLHASSYDKAWRTGDKLSQLKMTYSEKKIVKIINRTSRFSLKSRKEVDGKIRLRIRRLR